MSQRKQKLVMAYLCKVCSSKKSCLVSPNQIAQAISKKCVLTIAEIDEIMAALALENYLDFVVSDSKEGYYYCVTLRKKGQSYILDSKKQKKTFGMLILRSIFLATVSFVFGVILRAIFKG